MQVTCKILVLLNIIILICGSSGYNVLMVCPAPSKSHNNLCRGVTSILLERGHEVTFVSPFPNENSNMREIGLPEVVANTHKQNTTTFSLADRSPIFSLGFLNFFVEMLGEALLSNNEVQQLFNDKSVKYDAFILENFINDYLLGLGVKFKCPTIVLSPLNMWPSLTILTDTPPATATVPFLFTRFSTNMNLWQRVMNTLATLIFEVFNWALLEPKQEFYYKKQFPKESLEVPYSDIKSVISTTLINSHPSVGVVRPLLPNAIEIGGYHITDPDPLPEDLKNIIDNAKEGVVFFSMGSNLKSSEMNAEVKQILLKVLGSIKQTVLWKFEEDLPDKPKNVIIKKWMPQTGILAHPNVKLFISHGGLLSITEATHFGVPLLMIPVYGDQYLNAKASMERGQGLFLPYHDITESFEAILKELLTNKKYMQTSKELSLLYHDRPMKPRDLVGFQIEYVIRTKGAKHLLPPSLPRYSQYLLDVALVIIISISLIIMLLKACCRKMCCKKSSNKLKTN